MTLSAPARQSRTRSAPSSLCLLLCLLITSLTSCARGRGIQTTSQNVEVSALAVAPFTAAYPAPPWAAYIHTVEAVDAATKLARFPVYAFGDFDAFQLDGQDFYAGTSLMGMIDSAGLNRDQVALLRGSATAVDVRAPRRADPGDPVNGDLVIELRVELYHLGLRQIIAAGEERLVASALERTGDDDPHPEISRRHRALAAAVLKAAAKRMPGSASSPLPLVALEDHHRIFLISDDEHPSLARRLQSLDPIDEIAMRLRVYGWLYPDVDPSLISRLGRADHGLLVTDSSVDELIPGDVILSASQRPMDTRHQLQRLWIDTPAGETLPLEVERQGARLSIELHR